MTLPDANPASPASPANPATPPAPLARTPGAARQLGGARRLLRRGAQVVLADTVIAAILVLQDGGHFWHTLVYAQVIGLLTFAFIETGRRLLPHARPDGWPRVELLVGLLAASCVAAYLVGTLLVDVLFGFSNWQRSLAHPGGLLSDLALTGVFCALVSSWFFMRARALDHRAEMAAATHEATLARLVLLQSQLEPHMLFNTLANLRALIGADPPRAQEMLDRLIDFLRATLAASRAPTHPLRDEFARLGDYLALMQVRMGDRLRTQLDLPAALADIEIPPLLLQPLVENAIKHGLEPQRGPGELRVSATMEGATLQLVVTDSGRGLEAAAAAQARAPAGGRPVGSGFGVSQVRERLHTLHGDAAGFTLAARPEGGTRAEIRLPLPAAATTTAAPLPPH